MFGLHGAADYWQLKKDAEKFDKEVESFVDSVATSFHSYFFAVKPENKNDKEIELGEVSSNEVRPNVPTK